MSDVDTPNTAGHSGAVDGTTTVSDTSALKSGLCRFDPSAERRRKDWAPLATLLAAIVTAVFSVITTVMTVTESRKAAEREAQRKDYEERTRQSDRILEIARDASQSLSSFAREFLCHVPSDGDVLCHGDNKPQNDDYYNNIDRAVSTFQASLNSDETFSRLSGELANSVNQLRNALKRIYEARYRGGADSNQYVGQYNDAYAQFTSDLRGIIFAAQIGKAAAARQSK